MIKDLLVHVDSTDGGRRRLEYAFDLADRFDAQLTGIHVVAPVDVPPYFKPHSVERVAENLEQWAREDATQSERLFREMSSARSTPVRWRMLKGHVSEQVCEQSRCADLVVLGQYEAEGAPQRRPLYLAEEVVLEAGCPILVVPESLGHSFRCDRVLIGWDGSREAARAVHDSLPLLTEMKPRVEVMSLDAHGRTVAPSDLAQHLSRHGLSAEISPQTRADGGHGATLASRLDPREFDLLVVGAYGHPVWLQLLFGGSTQSVLAHARTPVMISR